MVDTNEEILADILEQDSITNTRDYKLDDILNEIGDDSHQGGSLNADMIVQQLDESLSEQEIEYDQDMLNQILNDISNDEILIKNEKNLIQTKNQFIDPLDLMDEQEKDLGKCESYENLEENFLVTKPLNASKNSLNNLSFRVLYDLSQKIYDDKNAIQKGIPKSIIASEDLVILGTSKNEAILYNFDTKNITKLGDNLFNNYGSITSMDITKIRDTLVCGYDSGAIILWDLTSKQMIKAFTDVHQAPVLKCKFWKGDMFNIISSDSQENIYLVTITKMFFTYSYDKQLLIQKSAGIVHNIDIIRYNGKSICALAGQNVILIISLDPVVRTLIKFERPNHLNESVPQISFGNGSIPKNLNENNTEYKPILALNWGNQIDLVPLDEIDQANNQDLNVKISYKNDFDIIFMSWISKNLIVCIDKMFTVKLLQAQNFVYQTSFDSSKQSILNEQKVKFLQQIHGDIVYQSYAKDSKNLTQYLYSNGIYINKKTKSVYVLGLKAITKGQIQFWNDYLQELINQGKWMEAFFSMQDIYQNKGQIFDDHDKSLMQDYCKFMIKRYLEQQRIHVKLGSILNDPFSKHSKNEIEQKWKPHIFITIDFLLLVECYSYLFNEIKNSFERYDLDFLFKSCLETFILKNRVKQVHKDYVNEIIEHYQGINHMKVVKYLILNLDLKQMETGTMISICLEHNLFTPLIYICNRADDDFITPLNKMFNHIQLIDDENKIRFLITKTLWYIRMCFQGQIFPNEQLIDQKQLIQFFFNSRWVVVMKQVIIWLFIDDIFKFYLEKDQRSLFSVVKLLFIGKPLLFLQTQDQDLAHYFQKKQSSEMYFLHECILDKIIQISQRQALLPLYVKFIVDITELKLFKICKKAIYNCLKDILENHEKYTNSEIEIHLNTNICDLALTLLQKENQLFDQNQINELKQLSLQNEELFKEAYCYLLFIEKQYFVCFQNYLELTNNKQKKNLFKIIDHIYAEQTYPEIQDYIFSNITELVLIDRDLTLKFLKKNHSNQIESALEHLDEYPQIKLNFIEKLINDQQDRSQISDSILTQFVKLLCMLDQEKLLLEIKSYDYPIDACIIICQQYGAIESEAYLQEKQGQFDRALSLYIHIFIQKTEKYIEKAQQGKKFSNFIKLDKIFLMNRITPALKICQNYKTNNCVNTKVIFQFKPFWFVLIDQLINYYKNVIIQINNIQFKSYFQEIISEVFNQAVNNVKLEILVEVIINIQYLRDILNNLTLKDITISIKNIFFTYNLNVNIQKQGNIIFKDDIIKQSQNLIKQNVLQQFQLKAYKFRSFCSKCKEDFQKNSEYQIISFQCFHSFHDYCQNKNYCEICYDQDYMDSKNIQSVISKIDSKGKKGLLIQQKQIKEQTTQEKPPIQFSRNETNLRKLQQFEYVQKNQTQQVNLITQNDFFGRKFSN